MDLNLHISPFAKQLLSCTWCTSGSGLCGLSSRSLFPVATEEAPVKVSDSSEGLVADKRGVNSSVSLSLQGSGMTDHQRLEGHKATRPAITELDHARSTCHHKYCFIFFIFYVGIWLPFCIYMHTYMCYTCVSFYVYSNYHSRFYFNLENASRPLSVCLNDDSICFCFFFFWNSHIVPIFENNR